MDSPKSAVKLKNSSTIPAYQYILYTRAKWLQWNPLNREQVKRVQIWASFK